MAFISHAKITSICTRVFSQLRAGMSESVYRNALAVELHNAASIKLVTVERAFPVHYKVGYGGGRWVEHVQVGTCYVDLEAVSESGDSCLFELKSVSTSIASNSSIAANARNQLEKYVRLSKSVGNVPKNAFLINFPKNGNDVEIVEYDVNNMSWDIMYAESK